MGELWRVSEDYESITNRCMRTIYCLDVNIFSRMVGCSMHRACYFLVGDGRCNDILCSKGGLIEN